MSYNYIGRLSAGDLSSVLVLLLLTTYYLLLTTYYLILTTYCLLLTTYYLLLTTYYLLLTTYYLASACGKAELRLNIEHI